jgi:type I restriction enzyme, S subunit
VLCFTFRCCFQIVYPLRREQLHKESDTPPPFSLADKLDAHYQKALTQLTQLTPSLLSKAFRGELVEQDPTDEPASVLLERVKAQRAAVEKPKKVREKAP